MPKVSAYLDEKVIDRLRREALRRHGSLRSLSREIEEIVRESFVVDKLEAALAAWTGESTVAVGFGDVKPIKVGPRPALKEIVREEREHRRDPVPRRNRRACAIFMEAGSQRGPRMHPETWRRRASQ